MKFPFMFTETQLNDHGTNFRPLPLLGAFYLGNWTVILRYQ